MSDLEYYNEIITTHAIAAAAVAAPGTFFIGVDLVGVPAVWIKMIANIAEESGNGYVEDHAIQKFCLSLAQGAALYVTGGQALSWMLALTGVGLIPAIGLNCALTYLFTYRLGKYVAEKFESTDFQAADLAVLFSGAKAIVPALLVLPSLKELKEAFDTVKHLVS